MTSSELVERLLPCPFCGATDAFPNSPSLGAPRWRVICDDCGAEGPPRGTIQAYDEGCDVEAIAAWNTRSDQPLLSATHYAEWQPIETAPKDGTRVILTDGRSVEVGCFAPNVHGDEHPWAFVDDYSGVDTTTGYVGVPANAWKVGAVTLWMPLPGTPPTSEDV